MPIATGASMSSPIPPAPGVSPPAQVSSGTSSQSAQSTFQWLREQAAKGIRTHWKKISVGAVVTWVTGQGLPLFDQYFLKILPIPDELKFYGLLFSAIFSFLFGVVMAILLALVIQTTKGLSRWLWLAGFSFGWLVLTVGFFLLFFQAEQWWKYPNTNFEFFYFGVEPIVYGMFFTSFAYFIGSIAAFVFLFAGEHLGLIK
jgi:hypothetical protein